MSKYIPIIIVSSDHKLRPTMKKLEKYTKDAKKYFILSILSYMGDMHWVYFDARDLLCKLRRLLTHKDFIDAYGSWEVVWGPVNRRFQVGSLRFPRRNTFILLRNKSNNEYVLSIAGTNPVSPFGWVVEDLEIAETIPYIFCSASEIAKHNEQQTSSANSYKEQAEHLSSEREKTQEINEEFSKELLSLTRHESLASIALGTFVGVTKLQSSMPRSDVMPLGQQQTLMQFLKAQDMSNTKLTVCGHSLGGTLTPVVAKWLEDFKYYWGDTETTEVYSWSFAGATPGNKAFTDKFNEQFDVSKEKPRAFRVWNELDLVPHAWSLEFLDKAQTLYTPPFGPSKLWKKATIAALETSAWQGKDYSHPGLDLRLPAHIPNWRNLLPLPNLPIPGTNITNHIIETVYQHSFAYFSALDIKLSPSILRIAFPMLSWIPMSSSILSIGINSLNQAYKRHLTQTSPSLTFVHSQRNNKQVANQDSPNDQSAKDTPQQAG